MSIVKLSVWVLALSLFSVAGQVWAQDNSRYLSNPANRPAVSPYINLTRGGSTAGVNYYGLVRPEIEFRSGIQQNRQQIAANEQSISALGTESTTGHSARYMTQWSYFMNNGLGPSIGAFRSQSTITRPQLPTLPAAPSASLQGYGPRAGVTGARR